MSASVAKGCHVRTCTLHPLWRIGSAQPDLVENAPSRCQSAFVNGLRPRETRSQLAEKGPFALSASVAKGCHVRICTLHPLCHLASAQPDLFEQAPSRCQIAFANGLRKTDAFLSPFALPRLDQRSHPGQLFQKPGDGQQYQKNARRPHKPRQKRIDHVR